LDKEGIVRVVRVYGDRPKTTHEGIDGVTEIPDPNFEAVTKFHFYDWIGAVEFAQYGNVDAEDDEGNVSNEYGLKHVGFCSGLTDELRKHMTENQEEYIGECMEISAMERTKDGYFRHPQYLRMRPDKNPKDCIVNED
jgi:hypothetical protein